MEDLNVDGIIILKWILGNRVLRMWNVFIWLKKKDAWQAVVNTVTDLWLP